MRKIVSQPMRDSARGKPCTVNIVGVCSYNAETTVLAHLPDESHGMSRKADDLSSAYSCAECHNVIDGRTPHHFEPGERDWYMRRAMVRTWRILVSEGIVQIKGVKR